MSPAPGWYDDPSGGDTYEFYWDGFQWSGDSRYKELEPVVTRSVLSAEPYHEPVHAHAHHGYHHDADVTYAIGAHQAESYHDAHGHDGFGHDAHGHDGFGHDEYDQLGDGYHHDGDEYDPEPAADYHDHAGVSFDGYSEHDPYDPAHYTDPFEGMVDANPFPDSSPRSGGPKRGAGPDGRRGIIASIERVGENPVLLLAATAAGLAVVGAIALVAASFGSEPDGTEQAVLLVDVEPVDALAGDEGIDPQAEGQRVAEDRGRIGQAEPAFVGDVVQFGRGWDYTVHAVAHNVESANEFDVPPQGFQFATVEAEVANNTGEVFDVSPFFCFQAKDASGAVYDPGFSVGIGDQFESGQLQPGERVRGNVVFEIPAEATLTAFLANCDLLDAESVAIFTLN
ncbi:MAG: DUF4352 domain-containing protein [Actinomycetota bacterium]